MESRKLGLTSDDRIWVIRNPIPNMHHPNPHTRKEREREREREREIEGEREREIGRTRD